jgi:WD40 repeat protein
VFDIPNLRPTSTITSHSAESVFISIALNYSGDRLLAGSTDKKVAIFNSETGKELHSFPGHGDKVNSVAWASTKEKCISGS